MACQDRCGLEESGRLMANGNERVEKWVRRMLADPMMTRDGARTCTALALMHVTSGVRSEVQTVKLGSKTWDARQLAEMFNGLTDEHAAGLASSESGSGEESYQLVAFFSDLPDLPVSPLPLMRKTGDRVAPNEPIVSEPPNEKGERQMNMRHANAWQSFTLEMVARTYAAQSQIIERQNERLQVVERENQDAFQISKEMILEKVADAHDAKMRELQFERSTEERARLMKLAPPLVNKLLGKDVFPSSTVDSSLLEALIESADEGQIEKIVQVLIPVLKPEQQALLIGRFAEIQESLNKRKAIVKAQANGNGKAS